jgi:hypothetical protein
MDKTAIERDGYLASFNAVAKCCLPVIGRHHCLQVWVHSAVKPCTIGVLSENVRPKLNTDVGVK